MKYYIVYSPRNSDENKYSDSYFIQEETKGRTLIIAEFFGATEAIIACQALNNSGYQTLEEQEQKLPF